MSEKLVRGFVKFPILPLVYTFKGPFIGTVRGFKAHNTPLDYGKLVSNYPRDGYAAKDWRDWVNGPDDDKPSVFGATFSIWLGTLTSSLPWLLVGGPVRGVKGITRVLPFLFKAVRTLVIYLPSETFRGIKRI